MDIGRSCGGCGGWISPYSDGVCATCSVNTLAVSMLRCVTCKGWWMGKGDECIKCRLNALSSKNPAGTRGAPNAPKANGSAPEADGKPRKKRVSRQVRQREFEQWFARWTAAHRARRASRPHLRPDAAEEEEDEKKRTDGEEDKTDWWRVETMRRQGGVCYTTPDAFFAALGDALARHRHSATKEWEKEKDGQRGEGTGGVLTFFGGYSIVALPNISAMARLDEVAARMEEIGFR